MMRTILATGASSGIGRAISQRLLKSGARVLGVARDFTKCGIDHSHFTAIETDLGNLDALPEKLKAITAEYPEVSGVVLCAGVGRFGSLEEFSWAQVRSLIDLNLTSQIFVVRGLLPTLKRKRKGDIIFIGSEAALAGGKRGAVYSATKFALRGLAQSLRQECAASGVRVSIINPGMVKTEFFAGLDFGPGDDSDNYILPGDVAEAVVGLLSMRAGTVVDEVNLTPLKKVIRKK